MRVVFSRATKRDLREIGDHISESSNEAANRFLDVLEARCLGLAKRPLRFRIVYSLDPPVRQAVEGRYRIFYSVREDHVLIERILSSSRHIDEGVFGRCVSA
ncbi:hypothetical protein KOAAANKH_00471 [Brevundimonas sp. NIBR10]|uniref:type II toxin-antitoxin system RelE/ParE family toxin n=1 Tax=Brevundimonas sp. NIBR10 TaxID=3015997 RepID=UPI0022F18B22|nr:type II toxin-antitoxin system RelE/ParE family toxin [Brevundimonas sp. NIBR10]WGM45608.1 hypothetical protein KOAAANKH_00471 [Brevundimonas sp. NIBR10]